MANLPAKQNRFSKIRNSIFNIALKNPFTKRIMANFAPSLVGYYLTQFVLDNDDQELTRTIELLSYMNKNAINENLPLIFRTKRYSRKSNRENDRCSRR